MPDVPPATALERRTLFGLLLAVSAALGWILLPFYGTLLWASVIALLFTPAYRWVLPRLQRRRTLAALVTLLMVVVMLIVPFTLVSASLALEALALYERSQSPDWNAGVYFLGVFNALPAWVRDVLARFGMANFDLLQQRLTSAVAQASRFLATRLFGFGQDTFGFVADLFITVYIAFFLIRDGGSLVASVRRAIPLAPDHKAELIGKFATVIRATVKGSLVVAVLQGALGGLAFWFLGIGGALLWAVLMGALSLLPAIGAALVWLPVALYLLAAGAVWQGLGLMAYGVLVIGLVDNLLRPVLVGKDTGMPDYVVMITTLGGMAVFGINGFIIGPATAAMFIAVWHLHAVVGPDGVDAR